MSNLLRILLASLACLAISRPAAADDWPQWRGPNRDGIWRETGLVDKFAGDQLELRWRVPVAGGYSGPTVADGRVYVTDRLVEPNQIERIHCFDWRDGKEIWSHSYDCPYVEVGYADGPRASVTVDDGRAYALGAMGHLFCLDAVTGKVLWQKEPGKDYKIDMQEWGIASAPLIEGDLAIVQIGAHGACLMAFDKRTGEQRWKALDDRTSYSAPIMIEQGGKRVLACWTGDNVVGLDPQAGTVYWKQRFKPNRMVISIASPAVDADRLMVSSFYDGSLMLKLDRDKPAIEQLWRRQGRDELHTDSLHAVLSTPYIDGDYVYGVDSQGELRCLSATTGDRIWENLTAGPKTRWGTIHMVRNGDRTWMFNERGQLLIAQLTPTGFHEISRAQLIEPTTGQLARRGEGVCWAHPAFAHRHVFARNDEALVCASLEAGSN
ncbi:MAG TPA: PQQ-binding-like beta-propeller repeat protein [Pirellulales bacterium]|jgi:outer membrane protein assembly factor BamB|nr:PQQ-binding-like beta-propeller repeat protein [Pirellulales bacterium]